MYEFLNASSQFWNVFSDSRKICNFPAFPAPQRGGRRRIFSPSRLSVDCFLFVVFFFFVFFFCFFKIGFYQSTLIGDKRCSNFATFSEQYCLLFECYFVNPLYFCLYSRDNNTNQLFWPKELNIKKSGSFIPSPW